MNVVFFSLRTKTAEDEQWWTAMLKKHEKLKKFNFTAIRSSNSHQNSKLRWKWTLFSSLFVQRLPTTNNDELQCFSTTWTRKIGLKMRFKPPKTCPLKPAKKRNFLTLNRSKHSEILASNLPSSLKMFFDHLDTRFESKMQFEPAKTGPLWPAKKGEITHLQ